jgi:hypothetical protein
MMNQKAQLLMGILARYKMPSASVEFINYSGSFGQFKIYVDGGMPYASIEIRLVSTSSGQSLGSNYFNLDAYGHYFSDETIPNTDLYWFPASQTNQFEFYQTVGADNRFVSYSSASS